MLNITHYLVFILNHSGTHLVQKVVSGFHQGGRAELLSSSCQQFHQPHPSCHLTRSFQLLPGEAEALGQAITIEVMLT